MNGAVWQWLCALLAVVSLSLPASGEELRPFAPGERLRFALRWEAIPAGEATLEVLPPARVGELTATHFRMTARTTPFIDTFYPVRDRIEGWTDLEVSRSLRYRKEQQEGDRRRSIVVAFDWEKGTAQYTNFGKRRAPIPLLPGSLDPLSAFYYTRRADLREGNRIEAPVTDGRKNLMGSARILRRETVTVPAGTFATIVVEPDLKDVGGVFRKSPGASIQIWLSDDHRRLPVRLQSRVIIGRFVGELVSVEYARAEGLAGG